MSALYCWKVTYIWSLTIVFGESTWAPPRGTYPYDPTTETFIPSYAHVHKVVIGTCTENEKTRLCSFQLEADSGKIPALIGYADTTDVQILSLTKRQGIVSVKIDTDGGNTPVRMEFCICDFTGL